MPRRTAARSRRWSKLRAGLARVGWLEDFAAAAGIGVVARRPGAAWAIGQGFRAVHFVEVGFVDAGGRGTARGSPLTPTLSP
ncbi:MAG: hypothetical protein QOJ42_5979 [Acidobacteriaceae bacterium]|nr:hypothetical protein [Acidobacteriaceae bacterium]